MQEVFEKIKEKMLKRKALWEDKSVNDRISAEKHINTWNAAIEIVDRVAEEYNNGWISVSKRLPEDGDCRFYMCIVENHEEEEPMLCQYEEEYGFGFYHNIYDEHTLGFVDSEFKTNEELGYEKVIAWQQIPKYQLKGDKE